MAIFIEDTMDTPKIIEWENKAHAYGLTLNYILLHKLIESILTKKSNLVPVFVHKLNDVGGFWPLHHAILETVEEASFYLLVAYFLVMVFKP